MSSRKNRQQALRAAKERRQKQIAIGGGILLAVLLAIQAPRLMHRGGSAAPAASAATTTTAGAATTETTTAATPAAGATTPGAALPSVGATAQTALPDSDVPPVRQRSQLATFELFDSKDPFVQQVADTPAPAASMPAAPAAGAPSTAPSAPPSVTSPATTMSTMQAHATTRTLAHDAGAVIAVNGKSERVGVDQTFPSASPTFRLVSVAGGVAMIGIANGGYASGAQTVALQLGKTLTLVDTTDSVRYELRLVSAS